MIITRQKLEATIHFVPGKRMVYLNNAKVACSSIKKAMWLSDDSATFDDERGPHDRFFAPFSRTLDDISDQIETFRSSTFFTVVRNPYTRILSAYLDKIGRKPRDSAVWHPFCRRHRLSADVMPTFSEFLRMVTSDEPSLVDQHFAPQYLNTLQPFVTCDFVGHIEAMPDVWAFLSRFDVTEADHRPHVTSANSSIAEFYGPEELAVVQSFYAKDFEIFGYSTDPEALMPVRDVQQVGKPRDLAKTLIQAYTAHHPDSRARCVEAIGREVPNLLTDYLTLETGPIPMAKLVVLSKQAIAGDITNWKLCARIGEELLRQNMVWEAVSVVHRAKTLMYAA